VVAHKVEDGRVPSFTARRPPVLRQIAAGNIDSGGDAATRGYADEEFKDQTFVTYRRTPTSIVIAASGKRIAETGRFEGVWRKPDGTMRRTGVYLAMWIPSAGSWRLK
jgi:hypothetical protein